MKKKGEGCIALYLLCSAESRGWSDGGVGKISFATLISYTLYQFEALQNALSPMITASHITALNTPQYVESEIPLLTWHASTGYLPISKRCKKEPLISPKKQRFPAIVAARPAAAETGRIQGANRCLGCCRCGVGGARSPAARDARGERIDRGRVNAGRIGQLSNLV